MNVPSIYDRVEVVVTDMKGIQHFSAMIDNTTQYELPLEGLAAGVLPCLYSLRPQQMSAPVW